MRVTKQQREIAEKIKAEFGMPTSNEWVDEEDGALRFDWYFETENQFSLIIFPGGRVSHVMTFVKGHGTTAADFMITKGVIDWSDDPSELQHLVDLFKHAQGDSE